MSGSKGYSGGTEDIIGNIGDLPAYSKMPNSLANLYDINGNLIQQRVYGPDGRAKKNIDWIHGNKGGVHNFPHIHNWNWNNKIPRGKAENYNE